MTRISFFALCAPLLVLPLLPAQTVLPVDTKAALELDVGSPAQFARAMSGRIGDDVDLDAVVLDMTPGSRRVLYVPNPVRCKVVCEVAPTPVEPPAVPPAADRPVDAAILRGAGPGGRDAILVVKAAGLECWAAAPGAQAVTLQWSNTNAEWVGARRVWVDTGPGGLPCVFGLNAAGTDVTRWQWNGSTLVHQAPIGTAMGTTNVMTMDYYGNGGCQIVMQLGDLVLVRDWQTLVVGAYFMFPPANGQPAPEGALNMIAVSHGRAPNTPDGRDVLVAYGYYFDTNPQLSGYRLFLHNSATWAFYPLPAADAASSIATYDHDGDGLEDVVLANWEHSRARVVLRQANSASFLATNYRHQMVVGTSRTDGPIDAVCGGDFDGDGDGDLVGFQSAHGYMHVVCGAVSAASRITGLEIKIDGNALATGSLVVPVKLKVVNSQGWVGPGDSLEVEYVGWVAEDGELPEQQARIYARVPFAGLTNLQGSGEGVLAGMWTLDLQVRLIVIHANGSERRLPPTMWFFSPNVERMESNQVACSEAFFGSIAPGGTGGGGNLEPAGETGPRNRPPTP